MQARPFQHPVDYAAFLFSLIAAFENILLPVVMIAMVAASAVTAWPWKLRFWIPLLVLFGLFLAWSFASTAWSIAPGESLSRFGKLSLTVFGGLFLCDLVIIAPLAQRERAARWLAAGLLIASAMVFLREACLWLAPPGGIPDIIFWMPVLPYSAIAVLCIFLILSTLTSGLPPFLLLAAITAAATSTVVTGSSASALALAAGAVVYAVVLWLGKRPVQVLAVLIPMLFLAVPLSLEPIDLPSRIAAQGRTVDYSTAHRLIIWRYVGDKVQDAPFLGHGLYAARFLPDREGSAQEGTRYADILAIAPPASNVSYELMPNHPHNASLQLMLDLGVVGAVLYAALYGLCLLAILRAPLPRATLASGAGLLVAVFVIGQLSFSVWQSWWLCAQFIASALFLALVWPTGRYPRP